MNPIWKERLRKWAPKAAYPAFYLFCLFIFLSWTFPYDKLKERIVTQFNSQQKSATNPQQLEIDELDSNWITGVKAKGVRLIQPAKEADKPPMIISIDEARARISLLSLLVGNKSVSFTSPFSLPSSGKPMFEAMASTRAMSTPSKVTSISRSLPLS